MSNERDNMLIEQGRKAERLRTKKEIERGLKRCNSFSLIDGAMAKATLEDLKKRLVEGEKV